jgi:hypothetical protein
MAKRKFVKADIVTVLKAFADRTYEQCGSHSYAAGYYEAMLAGVLAEMPRNKQIECLKQLQTTNYITQAA